MNKKLKLGIILGIVALVFMAGGLGLATYFSVLAENSKFYTRLGLYRDTGVASINRLALQLALEASKSQENKSENLLVASYDLFLTANALASGAGGAAQEGLVSTLYKVKPDRLATKKSQFLLLSKDISDARAAYGGFRALDSLWLNRRLGTLLPEFAESAKKDFGLAAGATDFASPDIGRAISTWQQKADASLPAFSAAPAAKDGIMTVNALSFRAGWVAPFDPARTTNQPFITDDKQRIQTPMMHRIYEESGALQWLDRPDYEALSVACCADKAEGLPLLRLVLVQPKSPDVSARAWLEQQNPDKLTEWLRFSKYSNVTGVLSLPRLNFTSATNLSAALQALAAKPAFEAAADFSGIAKPAQGGLALGQVLQTISFKADEGGNVTESLKPAADTGDAGESYVMTRFNRSFLVMLVDSKTGAVLMIGLINKP